MKKLILFTFLLIFNFSFAQERELNDSTYFISGINTYGKYYRSLNDAKDLYSKNATYVEEPTPVLLVEYIPNRIFKGFLKDDYENPIYIKEEDFSNDSENILEREYLRRSKDKGAELRTNIAKYIITSLIIKESDKEIRKYENYQKKGLIITSKEYVYEDYSDAFGLDLQFYNGYKKTIKYIELTVRSYNQVGDAQSDYFGKTVVRPRVIGPLKHDEFSSVEFNNLFYDVNDVISYLVITYMKVTFMDGTVKEIKNVNNNLGEDVYNGKGK
ncbi:hypothetical protein SAMN05443634_105206 [Chishuiella changwenlii]|uniref:Uncharacterized protein n=1 Tax=Chishuiella changwenlii TaxID=1434701 RepID=A0A1M6XD52_9FLAO|nr:hypothetical protein [Chishuiella changwenlii]GGF00488.1 hypothetical protein GCM10010984_17590 [Chishuiella changwenlii]SHL03904.1 hypothetical protein SAMN05443634_105206 [Chishuiella changwenlii]